MKKSYRNRMKVKDKNMSLMQNTFEKPLKISHHTPCGIYDEIENSHRGRRRRKIISNKFKGKSTDHTAIA